MKERQMLFFHPSSLIPFVLAEGAGVELAWANNGPTVFETAAIPD